MSNNTDKILEEIAAEVEAEQAATDIAEEIEQEIEVAEVVEAEEDEAPREKIVYIKEADQVSKVLGVISAVLGLVPVLFLVWSFLEVAIRTNCVPDFYQIYSINYFIYPIIAAGLGVVAAVLAYIAKSRGNRGTLTNVGMVCGILSVILCGIILFMYFTFTSKHYEDLSTKTWQQLADEYRAAGGILRGDLKK